MERRSKDELLTRLTEAKAEITALDQQYQGHYIDPESQDGRKWNELNAEVDELTKTVRQIEAREQRLATLSADPANTSEGFSFLTANPGAVRGQDVFDLSTVRASAHEPEKMRAELQDRAKRAVDMASFPHPNANKEDCQGAIERILANVDSDGMFARRVLTTGSPAYKQAFGAWVRNLGNGLTPQFQAALSLGTDADGGYAVPFELDPTIILTSNGAVNPYRPISRIVQLTAAKEWDAVTSQGVVAHRGNEASEASDDAPTLNQPTVRVERVDVFIPFSVELQQDWGGLATEMSMLIQDAKDVEEATSFTTGNGTAPNANGLLTGATISVNTAATATFASVDIDTLEDTLPPRFRPMAQFVANRTIYNLIRHFTSYDGPDRWIRIAEGLAQGGNTGQTLHGYRANECTAMGTTHASGDTIMVIGDFSKFAIVDRLGMSLELVPHVFGSSQRPTGQRGFYAWWRNNCKVLTSSAFVALKAL